MAASLIYKGKKRFFNRWYLFYIVVLIQIAVIVYLLGLVYKKAIPDVSPSPTKFSDAEMLIHPYLGFVASNYNDITVNNLGFVGDMIDHNNDEVKVGIFGGSVALNYYFYQKDNLIHLFQNIDKYKGKKIKVYSFALGGYKEPQQFLTLGYLLSLGYHLDVIINIDGFNEAALSYADNYKNGISSYYPRTWNLYSQQYFNKDTVVVINRIEDLKSKKEFFSQLPNIVSYFPLKIIGRLLRGDEEELRKKLQLAEKTYTTKGPEPYTLKTEKEVGQNIVNVWKNSSIQMAQLAEANNIDYFEFLQPNQYLPDSKPFSSEELNKYIKKDYMYAHPTATIYKKIIQEAQNVSTNNGVKIYDLSQVFMNETGTIYADDCCHYNPKGYSILTTHILESIKENE